MNKMKCLSFLALILIQLNAHAMEPTLGKERPLERWLANNKPLPGETMLHCAARAGHLGAIDYLIDHEADVNAKDNMGRTPLMFAAGHGQQSAAIKLLRGRADVFITDNGDFMALDYAMSLKNPHDMMMELWKAGIQDDPLRQAVDILLEKESVNNKVGRDIFEKAVLKGMIDVVIMMLYSDRQLINTKLGFFGRTALHATVQPNQHKVAKRLLKCQPDLALTSNAGLTAIQLASTLKIPKNPRMLATIKKAVNKYGLEVTPQDLAILKTIDLTQFEKEHGPIRLDISDLESVGHSMDDGKKAKDS